MSSLLQPLFVVLASLPQQDLPRQVVFLLEENRVLRSRLPKRVVITPYERSQLLTLWRDIGTQLRGIISIVSYDNFRRWVREVETVHITRDQPQHRTGRPCTSGDVHELDLRLARENCWGYIHILGEIRKLGITQISRQTVKAILKTQGISSAPDQGGEIIGEMIGHRSQLVLDKTLRCLCFSRISWYRTRFQYSQTHVYDALGRHRSPC